MRHLLAARRGLTIGRGLKLILMGQGCVAVFLLAADIQARGVPRLFPADMPEIGPIRPGDQIRHYNPRQPVPRLMDPSLVPDIDLPDTMPTSLTFMVHEDDVQGTLLILNGGIEAGDASRLKAFLAGMDELPAAVTLNSPGGVVDEALTIGRHLRERELDTLILPGMICLSSCPYVLAAGDERRVSLQGAVGLHQHYYETPRFLPVYFAVEDIQRSQGRTMEYLIEMGIDPGVMVHGLATPPEGIYVLVEEELLRSRLATEVLE